VVNRVLDALEEGSTFAGRYLVRRRIKSGGMGAVYEVVHEATKRRLALKTSRPGAEPSPALRARFEQEARITAAIDCEHLVRVEDAGVDPDSGYVFLTMELLDGTDFETLLEQAGPFEPESVVTLLSQVALALEEVHVAGVVHRDIKPENLFLTHRAGAPLVKILDFGVAKHLHGDGKTTAFVGTPLYMPPEQIRCELPTPRSDTFALGHVVFTLLTGHAFLEPGNRRESPTRRARRYGVALPDAFDAWFTGATHDDPARRFESAIELVRELGGVFGVEAPLPERSSRPPPRPAPPASTDAPASSRTLSLDGSVAPSRAWQSPSLVSRRGFRRTLSFGAATAVVGFLAASLLRQSPDDRGASPPHTSVSAAAKAASPASSSVLETASPSPPAPSPNAALAVTEAASPAPSARAPRPTTRTRERIGAVPRRASSAEDVFARH
jgi:serine/threonine-protein kinase